MTMAAAAITAFKTTLDPQDQFLLYVEEATKISPHVPGDYDCREEEKIEEFVRCADLWEKAARLITDSWIAPKNLGVYWYVFEESRFPLALASTCYANAGRALLSATQHKKIQEKNDEWNELDDRAMKLFKKALWAEARAKRDGPRDPLRL